ncbi:GNAT family N-acetyltransferase [Siccirubricoccus sp. G192]|uniref:GNAT family N-acetyltransferase n=1 Tax=Siccirubricoccus sp. G192 TaxID=2849651 RepID=UPI001C2BFA81|nr:GNAT family N-acetyltransferase [Siccirubricoccus sp. G192]
MGWKPITSSTGRGTSPGSRSASSSARARGWWRAWRGESYAGWLFIRYLWIAEPLRRQGIGSLLIREAEQRARARGCHSATVDTFSFQAPDFYLKQGFADLAGWTIRRRGNGSSCASGWLEPGAICT